jgi:hypothetical protein
MNIEHLVRQIDDVEAALRRDDPAVSKRLRALEPESPLHVGVVFTLLAIGAVLLTIGVATLSLAVWFAGVAAFAASFLVDRRRQRRHRAPPRPIDGDPRL